MEPEHQEYKVIYFDPFDLESLIQRLNKDAKIGWHISVMLNDHALLLERIIHGAD